MYGIALLAPGIFFLRNLFTQLLYNGHAKVFYQVIE